MAVKFRQWPNMIHFSIPHFLLVLFTLNLIEQSHSMQIKRDFDLKKLESSLNNVKNFRKMLFGNLKKESHPNKSNPHWILDHQRKFGIEETKNSFLYKLQHQWSKTRFMRPHFDMEMDNNNPYQRSTRKPFNIFAPSNNDRFDTWGG